MAPLKQKTPALIFFQEVRRGDIAKQERKSNTALTGGGARDLRIPKRFRPIIERFFPETTPQSEVLQGTIHWEDSDDDSVYQETISFWPPDNARPTEDRIGQIWKVGGWSINVQEWRQVVARGQRWFYLLVKDEDDIVWARLLYGDNLAKEDPRVKRYVEQQIKARKGNVSVRGSMNFLTGEEFP